MHRSKAPGPGQRSKPKSCLWTSHYPERALAKSVGNSDQGLKVQTHVTYQKVSKGKAFIPLVINWGNTGPRSKEANIFSYWYRKSIKDDWKSLNKFNLLSRISAKWRYRLH